LVGCTEDSPEEAELAALLDIKTSCVQKPPNGAGCILSGPEWIAAAQAATALLLSD